MPASFARTPDDCSTLAVNMEDRATGMKLTLYYTVFEDLPVITRFARLTNASAKPRTMHSR